MTPVPAILDVTADQRFSRTVQELFPTTYAFESRYVEHEFAHIGRLVESGLCPVEGKRVLEFGCNVGATSIVLAHYGAEVTALDVDADSVELAKVNAQRYGVLDRIDFHTVPAGEPAPFADASFDVVTCNSVLEYVDPELLPRAQQELDRVLRPGGLLVVFGTSNRLWPIESHSGRWLVNYVPRGFDRWFSHPLPRGVWPGTLRHGFGGGYDDVLAGGKGPELYIELKRQMGVTGWRLAAIRGAAAMLRRSPCSIGLAMPWATLLLQKRVQT